MAKTSEGKKIVSVKSFSKQVNGKRIRVKAYKRSTPCGCKG